MVSGYGFVKMAGFQAAYRPYSLLIRSMKKRYSGPFRLNQKKKDFLTRKNLAADDTDNTDLHGYEQGFEDGTQGHSGAA